MPFIISNEDCECFKRKCLRRVDLSRYSIKKAPESICVCLLDSNHVATASKA